MKKYSEAAATYEAAVKLREKRTDLRVRLASTYLRAGDREKAGATFLKIKDLNPDREVLNDVAYEMAEQDVLLPQALEFAKKATRELEEESVKVTLANLTLDDLRKTQQLAAYWDTVGWVDSRMSHFEEAEEYLKAAWILTQDGMVANHLCVLEDRLQKTAAAIEMCSLALNRLAMSEGVPLNEAAKTMEDTRRHLDLMTKKAPKSKMSTDPSDVVIRQRTFKLPRFLPGTESAEFFLLLSSDGKSKTFKVDDVKFISGSDKMKLQGKQLKNIVWNFLAPAGVSARFVRRGILGCYEGSGCSFVLLDPASVRSLN